MGRDLTQVLRRPVEPAAQSGHAASPDECPLLGGHPTLANRSSFGERALLNYV